MDDLKAMAEGAAAFLGLLLAGAAATPAIWLDGAAICAAKALLGI